MKKNVQDKKTLIALKIIFIKLLFLTFSFVLKCNLDSFLKAYMSYHSKNCWIVKGLKVQFCKQHQVKVVTSLDQKHYDFIFKITRSKSTYCTSGHRTSQYSVVSVIIRKPEHRNLTADPQQKPDQCGCQPMSRPDNSIRPSCRGVAWIPGGIRGTRPPTTLGQQKIVYSAINTVTTKSCSPIPPNIM